MKENTPSWKLQEVHSNMVRGHEQKKIVQMPSLFPFPHNIISSILHGTPSPAKKKKSRKENLHASMHLQWGFSWAFLDEIKHQDPMKINTERKKLWLWSDTLFIQQTFYSRISFSPFLIHLTSIWYCQKKKKKK